MSDLEDSEILRLRQRLARLEEVVTATREAVTLSGVEKPGRENVRAVFDKIVAALARLDALPGTCRSLQDAASRPVLGTFDVCTCGHAEGKHKFADDLGASWCMAHDCPCSGYTVRET